VKPAPAKSTHPRYTIGIVGCSSTAYDVIKPYEKDTYTVLLASRDLLNKHPRQEEVFLEGVLRLKPHLPKDAGSFHWGTDKDDEVMEGEEELLPPEGVYVGNCENLRSCGR